MRDFRPQHSASLLIPKMEPYSHQLAESFPLAGFWLPISSSLGRLRALVGETDQAVTDCEAGLELAKRMRAPLLAAESSLPLADVLLQRDHPADRQRARILLDHAIEVVTFAGSIALAEDAGAHLVADMARHLHQR